MKPLNLPSVKGENEPNYNMRVKKMCAHSSHRPVVAATNSGNIMSYSSMTGKETGVLYSHQMPEAYMDINTLVMSDGLIASGDEPGNLFVYVLRVESITS